MPNDDDIEEEDTTTADLDRTDSEMDEDGQEGEQPTVEELQAQLAQVQTQLKSVNDESAGRRVQLKKLEEEKRAKELSEMDDTDRLQAELADLKQQLAEREMQADELATLNQTIQAQVETLVKELTVPKYIQDLLEAMTPAKQLDYLNKNRKAFAGKQKRQPNIDASSKSSSNGSSKKERREKIRQRKQSSKRYSM